MNCSIIIARLCIKSCWVCDDHTKHKSIVICKRHDIRLYPVSIEDSIGLNSIEGEMLDYYIEKLTELKLSELKYLLHQLIPFANNSSTGISILEEIKMMIDIMNKIEL